MQAKRKMRKRRRSNKEDETLEMHDHNSRCPVPGWSWWCLALQAQSSNHNMRTRKNCATFVLDQLGAIIHNIMTLRCLLMPYVCYTLISFLLWPPASINFVGSAHDASVSSLLFLGFPAAAAISTHKNGKQFN